MKLEEIKAQVQSMSEAEFSQCYPTPLLMLERVAELPALEQAAGKQTRTVSSAAWREEDTEVEILRIEQPGDKSESHSAIRSEGHEINVAVGRTSGCDIRLVSNAVSKLHASIERHSGAHKYFLVDNDSHNGTWLNGHKLEGRRPVQLASGDVLEFARAFRAAFLDAHTLYEQLRNGRIATRVPRKRAHTKKSS